jgi:hypothetical protein
MQAENRRSHCAPRNRFAVVEDQHSKEILEAAISLGQLRRYRLRHVEETPRCVIENQCRGNRSWLSTRGATSGGQSSS